MKVTNKSDINLALAVWLLHDEYDYVDEENYISVTRLMRPLRHIVLPYRIPPAQREVDVAEYIPSALGKSLHDSIEKAWIRGYQGALKLLGYPESVISRVIINPSKEQVKANANLIPIYLEQRAIKRFHGYAIGGRFDMVAEGILHDNKSTSAYTWVYGGKDDDYRLQGSLYRWLNPEKITEDFIRINFIFTDWSKMTARQNPKYPQQRVAVKDVPLMSIEETEAWVRWKLDLIQKYWKTPETQLPECTDEELWRSAPQYKYYSDPGKTAGRSTKNFDTLLEATQHWKMEKAGKGIVITVPGEVKRCGYCEAYDICTQKDKYLS